MNYTISHPTKTVKGEITLPTSKSISNRVLIIQQLCKERFHIHKISKSNDTELLKNILADNLEKEINIQDAGTAMRFLTAFLSIHNGTFRIGGIEQMNKRPIGILVNTLKELGAEITYLNKEGFPPLEINGGKIQGGEIKIDASISSQFISALLLIAPVLENGLTLHMQKKIVSKPYIKMTLELMRYFGIKYTWKEDAINIRPQEYIAKDITIEQDWSAISFWCEIGTLARETELIFKDLTSNSIQGDRDGINLFKSIYFEQLDNGMQIKKYETANRDNIISEKIDCNDFPDVSIPLIITTSFTKEKSIFSGLKTLAFKETNRIHALQNEMKKYGVKVKTTHDIIKIDSRNLKIPDQKFFGHNDHRIIMSIPALALIYKEITIQGVEAVNKSYPNFWKDLKKVGFIISPITH